MNALGEVVLDGDILTESIDCETLRTMRYCVSEYLKRVEEREAEDESDSDYGIKTYADLAETCGGMVLANEIASHPLKPVSGWLGTVGRDFPVVHRAGPVVPHGAHRRAGVPRRGA